MLGGIAAVGTGAAGQDQHRIDLGEDARRVGSGCVVGLLVKQLGRDAFHAFERVGNGAWLLKDFLLHVVAVGAEFGRATVCQNGFDRALRRGHGFVLFVKKPVLSELQIHQVAFVEVDDLIGHTGQSHRVAGQKVFLPILAHTENQRRTGPRTDQPVWLILAKHGDGVGPL